MAQGPAGPGPHDPATWITSNDYPAAAAEQGLEGIVTAVFAVDANGKATGCTATGGGLILDDATCRAALPRASFDPARDATGKPIASTFRFRFRWQRPYDDDLTTAIVSASVTQVIIAPKGVVAGCALWRSGVGDAASPRPCTAVTGLTRMMTDMARGYGAGVLTYNDRYEIDGLPRAIRLPGSDIPPYRTREERMTVDDRGEVTECHMVLSDSADVACRSQYRFAAAPGRPPLTVIHTISEAFQPAR